MKNKITCLLAGAALFGATANAEIVLTDSLSAYGYIDMVLEDGDAVTNDTTTAVTEFELGLSFAPAESKWSAVVELSFDSGTDITSTSTSTSTTTNTEVLDPLGFPTGTFTSDTETDTDTTSDATDSSAEFETVTISYQYSDSLSFTVGNILSYQGFETFDATGLYQFSYASSSVLGNGLGTGPAMYSAAYAVGASADGSVGDFDYGVWIGDTDEGTNSYEYLLAYNGVENLTVKVILADDPGYETFNAWASYDYGDFTFAVETVTTDDAAGTEVLDLKTFMAYYAMGNAGLTVRLTDGDYGDESFEKFTISPSYAFSDNVFGLIEFSTEELGDRADVDTAAVELIYSF
jgi:hypothetical protein